LTADFINQFKVDYAVIGASALDDEGDLLDFDLAEVRVSRMILRRARKVFLVTDASKLARSAPVRLASLSEIDTLFIDAPLPEVLRERCAQWETNVHIV
jgi:DeoR family glycerol-3-phosphate regulon repressor